MQQADVFRRQVTRQIDHAARQRHGLQKRKAPGQRISLRGQALRDWQRSVGLPADGFPTASLLARLLAP